MRSKRKERRTKIKKIKKKSVKERVRSEMRR